MTELLFAAGLAVAVLGLARAAALARRRRPRLSARSRGRRAPLVGRDLGAARTARPGPPPRPGAPRVRAVRGVPGRSAARSTTTSSGTSTATPTATRSGCGSSASQLLGELLLPGDRGAGSRCRSCSSKLGAPPSSCVEGGRRAAVPPRPGRGALAPPHLPASIGPFDWWRQTRYLVSIAPILALLAAARTSGSTGRIPRLARPALLLVAGALFGTRVLLLERRPPSDHAEVVVIASLAFAVALAALLWRLREQGSRRTSRSPSILARLPRRGAGRSVRATSAHAG